MATEADIRTGLGVCDLLLSLALVAVLPSQSLMFCTAQ